MSANGIIVAQLRRAASTINQIVTDNEALNDRQRQDLSSALRHIEYVLYPTRVRQEGE